MQLENFMTLTGFRVVVATAVLTMAPAITASSQTQQLRSQRLPSVWVIGSGGTIAGRGDPTGASVYKASVLTAEELVKSVPEITRYADVKVEQLFNNRQR